MVVLTLARALEVSHRKLLSEIYAGSSNEKIHLKKETIHLREISRLD